MKIVTPDTFRVALDHLKHHGLLSLDTETTGLEWTDRLFSIVIATVEEEFYFDRKVLGEFTHGVMGQDFGMMLTHRPDTAWIFKNAKFDLRMLWQEGYHPKGRFEDIGIAARILKNDFYGAKAYSLASLAQREGQEKLTIVEDYIKEHNLYEVRTNKLGATYKQPQFDKVPLEIISKYACMDARLTYDLRQKYVGRMDAEDLALYDSECALIPICFSMELQGIQTDMDYVKKGLEHERQELAVKKRHFIQATGKEYQDTKTLLIPLFEAAGETIHLTDKGNPSLNDDVLETYTSPIAKIVQDIRFVEKRISTYYENYITMADDRGVIRPSMWQEGTRTGRFSYSNPNLQNIPKEKNSLAPYVVRGCFVPTEGNVFVSFDYSQLEYRMMLAYAEETRLIQEVMSGADVHTATAELLGIERDSAKTLNFAILYGAGPDKIGTMLGIPVAEASRLRTKYFLGLPKVERFIRAVIRTGESRGYVKNWLGRKLRADQKFCYALPNHLIQGGGADVVKCAMRTIYPLLNNRYMTNMILQVHDELLFDMHPSDFDLLPKIKHVMENTWPVMNGMKLLVNARWSDSSYSDRDLIDGFPE